MRNAGTMTSALYCETPPLAGSNGWPASDVPSGYLADVYCDSTRSRKRGSDSQKRSKVFERKPLVELPKPSKALPRERVVMVNVPEWVVGEPSYIYCTLLARVMVRLALRSILRSRIGSRVMRSWRSSVLFVVAGVATESALSSQPCSRALSIYSSPTKPNAKSRPGDMMPSWRFWPKISPTDGMKPGSESE